MKFLDEFCQENNLKTISYLNLLLVGLSHKRDSYFIPKRLLIWENSKNYIPQKTKKKKILDQNILETSCK
jgi:hypothetical protein